MTDSPERIDLPLPDYDHIPLGTLPSRIHSLDTGSTRRRRASPRTLPSRGREQAPETTGR